MKDTKYQISLPYCQKCLQFDANKLYKLDVQQHAFALTQILGDCIYLNVSL